MKRHGIRGISAIMTAAVMMTAAQPALACALDGGINEHSPESGYECRAAAISKGAIVGSTALAAFPGDRGRIYCTAGIAADGKRAQYIAEIAKMYSPYPTYGLSYMLWCMIASWLFE